MKLATNDDKIYLTHNSRGSRKANTRSILALKNTQKTIETDALLLANRIALLKQEELKMWKNIEGLKKKTQEVYFLGDRKEKPCRERDAETTKREDSTMREAPYVELRQQEALKREGIRQALLEYKRNESQQVKQQRQINEFRKREFVEKMQLEKKNRSQAVKEQEALSNLRKNEYQQTKLLQFKLIHEQRINQQEVINKKKEAEVLALMNMEAEIIEKLRYTQDLQKVACSELEDVIQHKPKGRSVSVGRKYSLAKRVSQPAIGYSEGKSLMEAEKTEMEQIEPLERHTKSFLVEKEDPSVNFSFNKDVLLQEDIVEKYASSQDEESFTQKVNHLVEGYKYGSNKRSSNLQLVRTNHPRENRSSSLAHPQGGYLPDISNEEKKFSKPKLNLKNLVLK